MLQCACVACQVSIVTYTTESGMKDLLQVLTKMRTAVTGQRSLLVFPIRIFTHNLRGLSLSPASVWGPLSYLCNVYEMLEYSLSLSPASVWGPLSYLYNVYEILECIKVCLGSHGLVCSQKCNEA